MHISIVVLCSILFLRTLSADRQDLDQYRDEFYADLAAANLQPGSVAEAVLFGRLLIDLGNRVNSGSAVEMQPHFDVMPRKIKRILQQYEARLIVGLRLVERNLRDLWQKWHQEIHDRANAFIAPLVQIFVEKLTAATGDTQLAGRLGAAYADVNQRVQQSMVEGGARNKRTVDNFVEAARRTLRVQRVETVGTYVALAGLTLLEVADAFKDYEAEVLVEHDWIDSTVGAELDALEV